MRRDISALGLLLIFLVFSDPGVSLAKAVSRESITISTYYPSPHGIYNQLTVNQDLRIIPRQEHEVSSCSFDAKGTLYYDDIKDNVMVCKKKPDGTYGYELLQEEIGLGTRIPLPHPKVDGFGYAGYPAMEDDNISTRAEAKCMLPNSSSTTPKKGTVTWDFGSAKVKALNISFATGGMCHSSFKTTPSSSTIQVSVNKVNWYDLATASCPVKCFPAGADMAVGASQTKIFSIPVRYIRVKNEASRAYLGCTEWGHFYINEFAPYE